MSLEQEFFDEVEKRFPSENSVLNEGIHYALFPPGKLFRPKLFEALCDDFSVSDERNRKYFAFFLETHHAYTLVHDDLPCMDDDEYRRGKLSVHAKYGEWQAILIGDALLNLSYEFLHRVEHSRQRELFRVVTWALGGKGLIRGQFDDLTEDHERSFNELIRIHELKTGRLIQLCFLGAYYLSERRDSQLFKNCWKLGAWVGVIFQLMDDRDDLKENQTGEDFALNLFRKDKNFAKELLENLKGKVFEMAKREDLGHFLNFIERYIT